MRMSRTACFEYLFQGVPSATAAILPTRPVVTGRLASKGLVPFLHAVSALLVPRVGVKNRSNSSLTHLPHADLFPSIWEV